MVFTRYAVMGNPVAHSLSPLIHQLFAKQCGHVLSYEKIQIDLSRFEHQVIQFFHEGGRGLNITLPCKLRAFALAKRSTPRCVEAKAANTLWMEDGILQGDNTDGVGLVRDVGRYIDLAGKTILLLGAGGAARGVLGSLLGTKPRELMLANRTLEKAQVLGKEFPLIKISRLADLTGTFDVIINATSASLSDENLGLSEQVMKTKPFCYDLAYNKEQPTSFVNWARHRDCVAIYGLGMLVEQAAEAYFIWHGTMPDTMPVMKVLRGGLGGV